MNEDKLNKKLFFEILYVVLILGVLIFLVFLFIWLSSEGSKCLQNPKTFYEDKTNSYCICNVKEFTNINYSLLYNITEPVI
jgi:hypothetical protein